MSNRAMSIALTIFVSATLTTAQPVGEPKDKKAPAHRIVRVSGPELKGPCEVSCAINPTKPDHILGVALQGADNFAFVSDDAGKSWKTVANENPLKRTQGDDCIIFTADGLAVRSYIAFNGIRILRPKTAANGIFTRTSKDGLTWSAPVPVIDHVNTVEPMEDKPWLCADRSKDSKYRGTIYCAWSKFDIYGSKKPDHKTHVFVSRSTDGGKSFSPSHRVSETPGDCIDSSNTVMGAVPAVGPNGDVYVVWAGPKGLAFVKSTNGGFTFGKEANLTETPGAWDFKVKGLFRCNGLPMMCVDNSAGPNRGTIYVNWADLRNGDPDIFVMSSKDGGATWTKPLRVNDDPKGNGKEQFFTWMAVDPIDGAVNIAFFDRRDFDDSKTAVTLARSTDGGKTFVNHKINQEAFAPGKAFFGDYLGIDALGGRVVTMYQHFVNAKTLAVSAAIFEFKEGTQETK